MPLLLLDSSMGKDDEEKKAEEEGKGEAEDSIVLTVFMHCEGCARKVRRCLKGFQGVESVETDCRRQRVVVKGEKADPVKVLGRLQTKTHRRVELISPARPPIPEPQPPLLQPQPDIVTVELKVHMHCEACAQEITRRIHRMKGVESVEADVKRSEVRVKGAIDPAALVQYVHRRTGKHAAIIVKQDPELIKQVAAPPENHSELEDKVVELKKDDAAGSETKAVDVLEETKLVEQKAESQVPADVKVEEEEETVEVKIDDEVKKNEYNSNNNNCYPPHVAPPQRYIMEMYPYPPPPPPHMVVDAYPQPVIPHAYPPQMFSDENPNACSLM